MLSCFLKDLFSIPGCFCKHLLLCCITFYPILYFTEHHLHKVSLRTSPTAEQPTESRCKEHDKQDKHNHGQTNDEEILWQEQLAKNNKLSLRNIKHKEWSSIHINKWQAKKYSEI